jgi:hypothetical protein
MMDFCDNPKPHGPESSLRRCRSKWQTESVWKENDDIRKRFGESQRKEPGNRYPRTDNLRNRIQHRRHDFVELKTLDQILPGLIKDFNFHESLLRMSFLAVSQSTKRALPSATRSRRSSRISLCQAGDSMDSGERARSSHSNSIAASFSLSVMSFKGRFTGSVYA